MPFRRRPLVPTASTTAGPSPAATIMCGVFGGQWTKSQASELPLFVLDDQDAGSGHDEKVFLRVLLVVEA